MVAASRKRIKGSLEPGKLADIAVLDRDIFAIAADDIKHTRATMTFVGGVERHSA